MKQKFLLLISILLVFNNHLSVAQHWAEMMMNPNENFYDIQANFDSSWAGITPDKGKGYKPFRRWEDFMRPRVYPKGNITDPSRISEEFNLFLDEHPAIAADLETRAASWTQLGPFGTSTNGGAGRINFVRFDPANSAIMYVGTPAGGLWKTTNSGASWTTNTNQLAVLGCTDIAIDPTNSNILYLGTGDGDAGDTYSVGVLKSTDAGITWNTTGLNWSVASGRTISKLLINPSNSQMILAATSVGIYRTTDGGVSWSNVQAGSFKDMEYRPADPTTVYACGTTFYKSTNSGASFTQITAGVPTNVSRLAIAVTANNNAYVYMIAANNTNAGLTGVYRSIDNGTTFTTRSTTPNYLGYNFDGSDAGGQGWYDLAIASSPTNAQEVIVGGINVWRSTNGGTNFTLNAHWTGTGAPYIHADIHDLIYLPGSGTTYYSGNDGGIFRTTNSGTAWTDISGTMDISQQYRLGLAPTNSGILITGHQDNGANRLSGGVWTQVYGGDGMDCFIDRTSNTIFFESYVYGQHRRSTNSGGAWTQIYTTMPNGQGNAAWLSPLHQDPTTATTFYAGGRVNLYRSTNVTVAGGNFASVGTPPGNGFINEFDIAPSNNQVIYALKDDTISKSINGGAAWTVVNGTLPVTSAYISNLEISPTDPNKVWVTMSGYSSGNKVFVTTNGGTSWTNYSTGLPNLPANCIVFQVGSASEILYVGTDIGVFVRDNSMSTWMPYLAGLPRTIVRDLEIYYSAPTKLRAATFGRGTWESSLYIPGSEPPTADYSANRTNICAGQSVNFTDLSFFTPTSWSWTFAGGTPATSTLQNPVITYNTPGTYAVTLVATNANGNDTELKTSYITVSSPQALPLVEGFEGGAFAPANWALVDGNGNGTNWERTTTASGFGTSTACSMFDNFNTNEAGGKDDLLTPKYSFTGLTGATMTFDVAYARYSAAYSDTLEVLVSTNCGVSFTQVFIKGGTTLATNGGANVTAFFIPTAAQWRTETVSLNAYIGQANVMVAFRNHGRYGQPIYVDNVNITGTGGSVPTASFTTSGNSICAGQTVTYTNTSTNTTSFSWAFPGGTPASGTTSPITVTYNTAGTYTTTLTATNAFGNNTATATINVTASPTTSNAGPDQTICTTGGSATMAGNTPAVGTGTWTQISGPVSGTITTPASATTTITGMTTAGTYVYRWSIANAPCVASTDQISVIVNAPPTASNAGPDASVCGLTATLAGNAPATGTGTWTQIAGPGTSVFTNANSATSNVTVSIAGAYTFRWSIANAPCTASLDNVIITFVSSPTASNAGPDQTICVTGGTATMTGNTPAVGTGTWTQISGPVSATITTPASATTGITGMTTAGTYVFQWSITNAPCVASTDQISVIVNAAPTASNAGPDASVCGLTATLAGNVPATGTGTWTQIAGPGTSVFTNANSATSNVTVSIAGAYTFRWSIANAPCTASLDNVIITFVSSPTASNAGPDQTICSTGGSATMAGNTPAVGTGTWTQISGPVSGTITTPASATTGITGLTTAGTYVFQWSITNAPCVASTDQISVIVNAPPTASNAGADQNLCGLTTTFTANTPANGTGTWTQVSGPGTSSFTNANLPGSGVTVSVIGTYVFQWTITNAPCVSSSDQVQIIFSTAPTTSNAGPDQTICTTGGTATMAGNAPVVGTGAWTQISGPVSGTITAPTSATTGITGMTTAGTYIFQWTISNGSCAPSTDQISVIVNTPPTASNAGPDVTVCGLTATLAGNTPVTGTGTWTQVSGPGTSVFTNANSATSNVTVSIAGAYTFRWTIANAPCTASLDNVIITFVSSPTTSNAGPDQTICATAGTATMAGNTPAIGTGTWTQVSGPVSGTITTPTSATTGITGLTTAGTYVFQWSITNAPCVASTDQISVIVNAPPTTSNAGPDATVCGLTATLAGNVPATGTGTWTQIAGPGTSVFTNANSATSNVSVSIAGAYTFRWTIANAPCTASLDNVIITFVSSPTASNAGPDQTICSTGGSATMAGNTPAVGTGTWTQISGPVSAAITTPASATTGITGMTTAGTYVFQWSITNAPCVASTDQISVIVNAPPTASNAGADQNLCGLTTTFTANTPANGTGTWTQISGPGTSSFTNANLPGSGVTVSVIGTYVFQWTITNAPCVASSDQVQIIFSAAPTTSNAGPDQTICATAGTATMTGNTPAVGTGIWTQISGPVSAAITTPVSATTGITGMTTAGTYVFQWSITNAPCVASTDQISVVVNAAPTASNAGADQNLCGLTTTFTANTPANGTGTWTQISGPGTSSFTNANLPGSGVTVSVIGTYVFQWTITNAPCVASSDQVQIIFSAAPTTSNAGSDQTICSTGGAASMAGNTPAIGTGAWTQVSGPVTAAITAPASATTGITGMTTAGTYVFQWTISNGACAPSTDQISVIVNAAPTTSNAGPDQVICSSLSNLNANTPSIGVGSWTQVSGPVTATIVDINNPGTGINGLTTPGVYVFQWTIANNPCTSSSDQVQVTVNSTPVVTATSNSPVCEGGILNLSATGGVDFDWTGPNSFVMNNNQNPSINPAVLVNAGIYTVTVTDVNGCSATATTSATIFPSPVLPVINSSNDTLFANPNVGFSFQWFLNGSMLAGEINSILVATQNGDYTVVITDGNGCTSSSANFNYVNTTSIEGNAANESIDVFPNPNTGIFNLVVNSSVATIYDIRIYNALGQIIYQRNEVPILVGEAYKIDLEKFAMGAYTMVIYIQGKPHAVKVIKK
jgi:hypothetical protein